MEVAEWLAPLAGSLFGPLDEAAFQTAEALAIVEQPDGRNRYEWVPVRNGVGRLVGQLPTDGVETVGHGCLGPFGVQCSAAPTGGEANVS